MSAKIVILCALFAFLALSTAPAEAQVLVNPYYYNPYAAYYNPYLGFVWGSNKGGENNGPEAPQPPTGGPAGGPSFTNNAPRF